MTRFVGQRQSYHAVCGCRTRMPRFSFPKSDHSPLFIGAGECIALVTQSVLFDGGIVYNRGLFGRRGCSHSREKADNSLQSEIRPLRRKIVLDQSKVFVVRVRINSVVLKIVNESMLNADRIAFQNAPENVNRLSFLGRTLLVLVRLSAHRRVTPFGVP